MCQDIYLINIWVSQSIRLDSPLLILKNLDQDWGQKEIGRDIPTHYQLFQSNPSAAPLSVTTYCYGGLSKSEMIVQIKLDSVYRYLPELWKPINTVLTRDKTRTNKHHSSPNTHQQKKITDWEATHVGPIVKWLNKVDKSIIHLQNTPATNPTQLRDRLRSSYSQAWKPLGYHTVYTTLVFPVNHWQQKLWGYIFRISSSMLRWNWQMEGKIEFLSWLNSLV